MAIIDADVARRAGASPSDVAAACLAGGATCLQLRVKSDTSADFLDLASSVVRRAHAAGATVIVNDRADIARLSGADGVHVGQDDLDAVRARALVGASAIVGLSTHTVEQLEAALSSPISYAAVGPVFTTDTKATGYDAIGLERVREASVRARARGIPLVAIGGITLDTAGAVLEAGADAVAVISDLLTGGNPRERTHQYLDRLSRRV